jgi:RNA polymerase sigma-70 factor, ECF subfamily
VEEPEPAVVRAAAAGDLAAFEHLVRAYQQHVWRFVRRLLGDAAVAEDVTQETFLRVFRRLPTFTFEAKFSTWLFQIARNAGIDELRSRQRRTRLAAVAPTRTFATAPPPPDARVEIEAALASLPVDLREVVVLIEVLGLRYHEAAQVLGVPEGTVKSRMFTARSRLHRWSTADDRRAHGEM